MLMLSSRNVTSVQPSGRADTDGWLYSRGSIWLDGQKPFPVDAEALYLDSNESF